MEEHFLINKKNHRDKRHQSKNNEPESEKEQKNLKAKLKSQGREVDYFERAKRLEEIPLLQATTKQSQEQWELQERELISIAIEERELAVITRDRLAKMKPDKDEFLIKLNISYENKLKEFEKLLVEEKKNRLLDRRVKRKEERQCKYLKDKEELEHTEDVTKKKCNEKKKVEREEQEKKMKESIDMLEKRKEYSWRKDDKEESKNVNISWRVRENEELGKVDLWRPGVFSRDVREGSSGSLWRAGRGRIRKDESLRRDDERGAPLGEKYDDKQFQLKYQKSYTSSAQNSNRFNFPRRNTFQGRENSVYQYSNNFTKQNFLKDLQNESGEDILSIILSDIKHYSEALEKSLENDILMSIIKLISKVCETTVLANKCKILQITLRENVFKTLNGYISTWLLEDDIQSDCRQNFETFLLNLMIIFDNALQLMPTIIWDSIRKTVSLIEINLPLIKEEKNYEVSDVVRENLVSLKEIISKFEEKFTKVSNKAEVEEELAPDDDYRAINVYPSTQELTVPERNFIRKNKITGSYVNVKHYLDVQFRLLREDFLNPIREDICDYINNINRTLFNIKVHENVRILERVAHKGKICFIVQIAYNKRLIQLITSEQYTKRFMNGALLIFTHDRFHTTILGIIEESKLSIGQLVVSFHYEIPRLDFIYLMIECLIFYEPYHQVLQALQKLPQDHLPMEDYIINIQSSIKPPKYLLNEKINFESLQGYLNNAQIKAIEGALSQEFVIIQGPPGTGKTFLGILIARRILELSRLWWSKGPMLVICYTNHALDQFLEKLLKFTPRIVRLGSQTKCEALKKHSLIEIIKKYYPKPENKDQRSSCQKYLDDLFKVVCITADNISHYKNILKQINIPEGIVSISQIRRHVELEESYFEDIKDDEFISWLLEMPSVQCSDQKDEHDDFEKMMEIYNLYFCDTQHDGHALTLMDLETLMSELSATIQEISEDINDEQITFLAKKRAYLKLCLEKNYEDPQLELVDLENPFNMPTTVRWQLYKSWLKRLQEGFQDEINDLILDHQIAYIKYNKHRDFSNLKVLKGMQIVGMTTTCAARMHSMIKELKSPIIIVEEAAEILEAHILPVLSEHCEHLIMIGDHKQLKPSTSDYVVDKKYHLGVSLFERMVHNNVPFYILNVQHRMRPEISSLLCPTIYQELKDHESVTKFPPILGIDKSVYFVDHLEEEQSFGDSSKMNIHEAKFIIKLAEYLLKNNYSSKEITILTAYTGQVFTLEKERKYSTYPSMKSVEIKALDNFQGEENKIILLSLVRSNSDDKIGFLSLENRICVALSRAREGLYIIGNMTQLCTSNQIWKKINNTLMSQDAVGSFLPLRCQNHKDTVTLVKYPEDFSRVPEGGCRVLCKTTLKCGHNCTKYCHIKDKSHINFMCQMPCERFLCENEDHKCKKRCYEECGKCKIPVSQTLACGHIQPVPCYIQAEDFKCLELVSIELTCGHSFEKPCHSDTDKLVCTLPCEVPMPNCSHPCRYNCHKNDDPEHKFKYRCAEQCMKNNVNCQEPNMKHKCLNRCYQPCFPCRVKVRQIGKTCRHIYKIECHKRNTTLQNCFKPCLKKLSCNHQCRNLCYQSCGPCTAKIFKPAECGHTIKTECGQNPDPNNCLKPCAKLLNCGHKCKGKCNMKCEHVICIERCSKFLECGHTCIKRCGESCACKTEVLPKCAHSIQVRCNETPSQENCHYPCKALLKCNHKCQNLCNEPCTIKCLERCNQILQCRHLCRQLCHETCRCDKNCN